MDKQICTEIGQEQWRINLRELKNRSGKHIKQIADEENLSEKSIARIFSGEAKNPGVDLVRRIIHSLGGHWSEIFAETGAVIGDQNLATLQAENAKLTEENAMLKEKVEALREKNDTLKDEIIAWQRYYIKLKSND